MSFFKNCPNITHFYPINYIITHMTMHFFILKKGKIQDTCHKCKEMSQHSLDLLILYYFSAILFWLTISLILKQIYLTYFYTHKRISLEAVKTETLNNQFLCLSLMFSSRPKSMN